MSLFCNQVHIFHVLQQWANFSEKESLKSPKPDVDLTSEQPPDHKVWQQLTEVSVHLGAFFPPHSGAREGLWRPLGEARLTFQKPPS